MSVVRRAILLPLMLACAGSAMAAPPIGVRQWREGHEVEIVDRLDRLVRLPSVAADPKGLDDTAAALDAELKARGFETQLLAAEPGTPKAVFGKLDVPGAKRTVVFYAHYDGQPVTPAQWKSDPFAPVMRSVKDGASQDVDWRTAAGPLDPEWRLFARGVADDKASIVAFLAALDALKAGGRKPAVNLRVFWEGEEEAGSPHLPAILQGNADMLKADLWLIGDGPVHQSRQPSLYFGVRGALGLEATIYGPLKPLHDGHYGNWVPNPAAMAARLVAQMRDEDGTITIPGVSDMARVPSAADQAAIAALPPVEEGLMEAFGIGRSEGDDKLFAAVMAPALNVRGISAGKVGASAVNAIPSEATVSFDFRLVPDQGVDEIKRAVESFLDTKGWTVVRDTPDLQTRLDHPRVIRLDWEPGYPGLRTDISLPVSQAVIAAASKAAGKPVIVIPLMGGSVPLTLFDQALKTPLIGLPIVNHDNNQHAADENLRLQNLWDGIETYAALISTLDW